MKNRFQEWDLRNFPTVRNGHSNGMTLNRHPAKRRSNSFSVMPSQLVILIENGGVDLGIPALVDALLSKFPGIIADQVRPVLVKMIGDKIREWTDTVAENFELNLNRYSSAKGQYYDDVQILRNGSASYNDLKDTLIKLSKANIVSDLLILTHGGDDSIVVSGDINGQKIRDMKTENGGPLKIRSVYMMNCVGSSLNQAWLDAGAKVSCGTKKNNYLPEPTTFFFFSNWKSGNAFQVAASSAYQQSIAALNGVIKAALASLPFGVGNAISIDAANFEFVQDSAPEIVGDGAVTVQSKDLSFTQSMSAYSFTTTVVPTKLLRRMRYTLPMELAGTTKTMTVSPACIGMIKKMEGFKDKRYNDAGGNCTVGYGTVLHNGACNESDSSELPYINGITDTQATELLVARITAAQKAVQDLVKADLNQNQFDAIVSFVHNVTPEAFARTKVLTNLNSDSLGGVVDEMRLWIKAREGGNIVISKDLVERRTKETELFTRPVNQPPAVSASMSRYSKPFYDTGEHSLLGQIIDRVKNAPIADIPELDPTQVYSVNGVDFNYGQIITMGDFYANFQQMNGADPAELDRLKAMIVRSENSYKQIIFGIGTKSSGPDDDEWDIATGGRYLDLAAVNNSHFSPPQPGSAFENSTKENNKANWRYYHEQAINIVRQGSNSNDLKEALKMNAFGDHFLTDSFSAGHLINKEDVMDSFLGAVVTNGTVNSTGSSLLGQIAKAAFTGNLKEEFSKYQTSGTKYKVNGYLDDASMFQTLLEGILTDKPEMVANLFVKAIHDKLNKDGVMVTNAKGKKWRLSGDGTLKADDNMLMIQEAVAQSVKNVTGALQGNDSVADLIKKVWDWTPILEQADTLATVNKARKEFLDFKTGALVTKAVQILGKDYNTLIKKLIAANAIEPKKDGVLHPWNELGNAIHDM